ncbi:hypothetical protein Q8A67_021588 [Cirrhinus molitorella]|uniref:Uncharacterized protein n=1 Tax=Cirrhinus molitorella TaxID=172907 RepID=A0AA88TD73_9TELE|nr:hypothetical protein Q8A67_021588 [Cirrhinus molitorella]
MRRMNRPLGRGVRGPSRTVVRTNESDLGDGKASSSFKSGERQKHLGGGWTLHSFPVWRPSLPVNLLRHTEPAAVPFKQQPLRSNFHVNKCSQVGVAMAISPWLPWRRDWGGTGSRFAVDS